MRETTRRGRRLLGRERDLGARRAAQARRATSPIPTSPTSAAGCGSSAADGANREGAVLALRAVAARQPSRGSARSPAATARSTRCGAPTTSRSIRASATTSRFPYLMVQRGRRAVYEPEALAFEKPTPTNEDEYRRKVRMFEHCWLIVLPGQDAAAASRRCYALELVSHRHLRYASGLLHLVLLATARSRSSSAGWVYDVVLGLQLGLLAAAAVGVGIARYYVLVSWATVVALWNYLRARRARRPGRRRRARAEPRARRRARRRSGSCVASPVLALAALAVKLEDGGPGALPADARRQGRRGLRAAEAADDGRRRRDAWAPATPSTGATRGSRGSAACCGGSRSTSCRSSGTSSAAR